MEIDILPSMLISLISHVYLTPKAAVTAANRLTTLELAGTTAVVPVLCTILPKIADSRN